MYQPTEPHQQSRLNRWPGNGSYRPSDRFSHAAMLYTQLQRYRNTVGRRWWIVGLALLLIGGPSVYYAVTKPTTYQSLAIMWMTGKLNLPEGRLYAEELNSYMGTQAELIKSPAIRVRAMQKVGARFPEYGVPGTNDSGESSPFKLTVKSSLKSSTLELKATGPSPEATRVFLDEVMEQYVNFKRESRKQTSFNALSTITDQIREVEKQIQEQQDRITAFQTSNNIAFLTESGLSAGSHLAKLNELLSDLKTEFRLLELLTPEQFKDMGSNARGTTTGVTVPGEKTSQNLAASTAGSQAGYYQALQQLQLLKGKREELAKVLRPAHSKMVKLDQEINGLEKLLNTLRQESDQQALSQMVNRKKSLELQIQNLESQYRSWQANAIEASRKLAEYERMRQQMQRHQGLYDRLLGLVQAVDLNKNLDQESLSPLAPASFARPNLMKYKIGAAGILLGLMAGMAVLMLATLLDDKFTSVTELSLHLPEDIVGQVPESALGPRGRPQLLKHADETHAFAEAFRNLRSWLLYMPGEQAKPKVMLVTSAVPKEGKTTVAANLATSLAIGGSRVLLIDGDLRRSSLHKYFGIQLRPGLREVLCGLTTSVEAIVSTQQPNLFVMPAGEAASSSSEMFLRSGVNQLLQDLSGEYEHIIVDTAPVLATDDVTSLGPKTDGVFVVVRASYTSSRMTREALSRLHKRNVKVLGVIYNRAQASTDYYYKYSKDYYSKDEVLLPAVITSSSSDSEA